ncbi:MAG: LPXTG cell wall anchor domain-containing protein [Terriglobales bacterium]
MTALRLYPAVLGGATVLALGAGYFLRKRRKTPEQLERERRLRISVHGRIIDGTIIDAQEVANDDHAPVQLLIYRYDVSGVSYEASQDITHLRQFVDIHTCKIGLPSSVKYDPQNPGDSIVISEQWSGLRLNPVTPLKRWPSTKPQPVK